MRQKLFRTFSHFTKLQEGKRSRSLEPIRQNANLFRIFIRKISVLLYDILLYLVRYIKRKDIEHIA